jgi:hypothetical protein
VNDDTVEYFRRLAADDLEGRILGPLTFGESVVPEVASGVYIVEGVDGSCLYVGRVWSAMDSGRLESRLREHRGGSNLVKLNQFDGYYVVPIRAEAGLVRVEQLEGLIADHLQPTIGKRRPDPRRRRRRRRRRA